MGPEKFGYQRGPYLYGIGGVDHEVTVRPEIRQEAIFGVAAGGPKSIRQTLRKFGPEVAVVTRINP